MKKTAAILLMIFYMIPALGFSITTHFCAGELADVSFYADDPTKCICGAEKMGTGCCSTNTNFIKIKDFQSKDAFTEVNFVRNITQFFYSFAIILTQPVSKACFYSFGSQPDIPIDEPIYILNKVFRI